MNVALRVPVGLSATVTPFAVTSPFEKLRVEVAGLEVESGPR
jgi:hypothetical protein